MKMAKICLLLMLSGFYIHFGILGIVNNYNSDKLIAIIAVDSVAMFLLFNLWKYGLTMGKSETMGTFLLYSGLFVLLPIVFVFFLDDLNYWVIFSGVIVITYLFLVGLSIKNKTLL